MARWFCPSCDAATASNSAHVRFSKCKSKNKALHTFAGAKCGLWTWEIRWRRVHGGRAFMDLPWTPPMFPNGSSRSNNGSRSNFGADVTPASSEQKSCLRWTQFYNCPILCGAKFCCRALRFSLPPFPFLGISPFFPSPSGRFEHTASWRREEKGHFRLVSVLQSKSFFFDLFLERFVGC